MQAVARNSVGYDTKYKNIVPFEYAPGRTYAIGSASTLATAARPYSTALPTTAYGTSTYGTSAIPAYTTTPSTLSAYTTTTSALPTYATTPATTGATTTAMPTYATNTGIVAPTVTAYVAQTTDPKESAVVEGCTRKVADLEYARKLEAFMHDLESTYNNISFHPLVKWFYEVYPEMKKLHQ